MWAQIDVHTVNTINLYDNFLPTNEVLIWKICSGVAQNKCTIEIIIPRYWMETCKWELRNGCYSAIF